MAINEKEKAKICFCEQCGSPLQPEDKFCSCCGQRIYTDKKFETVEDKDVQEFVSKEKVIKIEPPKRNLRKRRLFAFLDEEEAEGGE